MRLRLAFWAENAAEAREQARAWAAAEPNVASYRIVSATQLGENSRRWTVTVRLAFRERYEQEVLGLA